MTKKLLISLSVIGIAAVIAVSGTTAYFSDTEEGVGNVFAAGTVDIWLGDEEGSIWEGHAIMEDMKPCYTDYVNFVIYNDDGESANPVNVYKRLHNIVESTGVISEPECTDQGGIFFENGYCGEYPSAEEDKCIVSDNGETSCWFGECEDGRCADKNKIHSIIEYDLSVEVYNSDDERIWWQTIYDKEVTIKEIKNTDMYLGMIPAGGYMKVTQSYHMKDLDRPTNWAQGDEMEFDIEVKAVQLRGEAWLDNKEVPGTWKVLGQDGYYGNLSYEVKHPTFDFSFEGKVPSVDTTYVLAAGMKHAGGDNYDVDTYLGEGMSDDNGEISFSDSIELDKDMKDVKVWLIPKTKWNDGEIQWLGMGDWLWERGLIWYEDTDL